ncbi:MAG: ATP phosphoribosyltransferase regulatory subunit [Anaerolineae bacterium]
MDLSGALARQTPVGVADLFYEQAAAKTMLEQRVQHLFANWGYARIIPPTFEYFDTLSTQANPQLRKQLYRFVDRTGQMLALRADMTVPIARIAATKLYDQPRPLRFYYVGNVFRHEEIQAGRHREFSQAGVELLGAGTAAADAEIVSLAIETMLALGLVDFQINLGHVGYLQGILSQSGLDEAAKAQVERAVDQRSDAMIAETAADLELPPDVVRAVRAIPHLCGGTEVLDRARGLAPNAMAIAAVERLAEVHQQVKAQKLEEHLILDLGEIRTMGYYTGIAFHGYASGLGFPVCSGGRYDDLVASFGSDMPAVGFALGIERAMLVTRARARIGVDLVVGPGSILACLDLARRGRQAGLDVQVDVLDRQPLELAAYARATRARHAVYCRGASAGEGQPYLLLEDEPLPLSAEQLEKELASWTL